MILFRLAFQLALGDEAINLSHKIRHKKTYNKNNNNKKLQCLRHPGAAENQIVQMRHHPTDPGLAVYKNSHGAVQLD